jgi:hypothetical protein
VRCAGLASTYRQKPPESGTLSQSAFNGTALYTTYFSEAELLESSADLEGAVYRVSIGTAGFNARRAAVAATLVTWREKEDSIHFINPYYGSMLARNASNYSPKDRENQQFNFLPYAIVRSFISPHTVE